MTETRPEASTFPVVDYVMTPPPVPAGTLFKRMDGHRAAGRPAVRTEEAGGYWIFTDHSVILDGLQQPDLWSSSVIVPVEPDPPYKWIPIMLDPPEHTKWRHLLGGYFSPGRTKSMLEDQQRLAADLISQLKPRGECDFVRDFAQVYPSTIFLQIMGMPQEKLREFLEWEHMILHQDNESDPDRSIRFSGMQKVTEYFKGLIAERRANPDPNADDIVSQALTWRIDGEPVSDADVLNCLLLLFMAGLDTVASQLSYMMYHFATHPEDRARIIAELQLIPQAVEEILRVYPIVQTARKATRDANFHGCPIKAGDMAAFPLSAAGRDEQAYPDAQRVDLDRKVTRHLSFGGGPHRCLGSHLARQELNVVLEAWHKAIPEYELVEEPQERGGGVWKLIELKLRWPVS